MDLKEKIKRKKELEQKLTERREELRIEDAKIEAYTEVCNLTLEIARHKFTDLTGNEADVETARIIRTLAFQIHKNVIWSTHVKNSLLSEIHNILAELSRLT